MLTGSAAFFLAQPGLEMGDGNFAPHILIEKFADLPLQQFNP